jgi:hypothetical protein
MDDVAVAAGCLAGVLYVLVLGQGSGKQQHVL